MIVYRNVESKELDLWFEICEKNFGSVPKKYFSHPYYEEEKADLKDIIIAEEDGKIIGGVRVVYRQIKINEETMVIGGVTDINVTARCYFYVFVELLQKAFEYLRSQKIYYVLGFTAINAYYFYQKLHTFEIEKRYNMFEIQGTGQDNAKSKIERFHVQDLQQIIHIYNKIHPKEEGYIVRTPTYWDKFVIPKLKYACVYKKGNTVLGYITLNGMLRDEKNDWYWNIGEYYEMGGGDILNDLVRGMIKEYHLPNRVRIPNTIELAAVKIKTDICDKRMKVWYLGEESQFNMDIIEGIQKAYFWGIDEF